MQMKQEVAERKRMGIFRKGAKALQRSCVLLLCGAFFLMVSSPSSGAIFKVNSSFDVNDLSPGNGLCVAYLIIVIPSVIAACTLRAAIEEANSLPGKDIIYLSSGTYTLSIQGEAEDESETGDLDITESLILVGAGAATTFLDGGGLDRVLDLPDPGIEVSISGVTIRNGKVSSGQSVDQRGGGGVRNFGSLSLDRVTIKDNRVEGMESGDNGGGLKNLGSFTLSKSSVEQNSAHEGGGFSNSTNGILSLTASSVSDNSAGKGGGGLNYGWATVQNSTLSSNRAENIGGGIHNRGVLDLTQSTIVANSGTDGGGINNVGTSYLLNSIVANNHGGDCRLLSRLISRGNNLDSDDSCGLSEVLGDITGTAPRLGPLKENKGGTKSHLPYPGSPVIDAGKTLVGIISDQRGMKRPQGKGFDIGAIETEGFALPPLIHPLLLD